jgi:mitogen-activated protein kinase kinase 1
MSSWVGTLTYMSPERLKGDMYRSDTDIWSLGIVLVECAFGKYPYNENYTGFWEMLEVAT